MAKTPSMATRTTPRAVPLELTQNATPCTTQSHWFVEGRIARISHKVRPEDARWYARVLREGPVRPGMAVRVVPARREGDVPGRRTAAEHASGAVPRVRRAHGRHALPFARCTQTSTVETGPAAGVKTPATREALLEQHAAARRRRNAAELGSHDWEGGLRRGRPDRGRDRPPGAGDGPAQGLGENAASTPAATRFATLDTPQADHSSRAAIVRPMDGVVLVLNQNYEPLNVCNIPRAFRLVFGSKAEVIEYDHAEIRTVRTVYKAPSIIRLQHQIRRPRPRVKLTRREIFSRDRHTCQYCGAPGPRPHPRPRRAPPSGRRAHVGQHVAACKPCNHRKGGRTPEEAHVRLVRVPFEPRSDLYSLFTPYLQDERNEDWRTYLFLGRN